MKRLISILLAALICIGLCACQQGPTKEPEKEPVIIKKIEGIVEDVKDDYLVLNEFDDEKHLTEIHIKTKDTSKYCKYDYVTVTYANRTEPTKEGDPVVIEALDIKVDILTCDKPIIYFYPEQDTECTVNLNLAGKLTCAYPEYQNGWQFTAKPDGTLVFPDGKEYYALYWEGTSTAMWDFSKGFCVKGEDTAEFLEWALAAQGLNTREANEFIVYWLPLMQENPYNIISFQTDVYKAAAQLNINPAPDSMLRIFMAYYASDTAVEIEAQKFTPFERAGFTVVEWGGGKV